MRNEITLIFSLGVIMSVIDYKLKVVPFSASVVRLITSVIDYKFTKLFHSQLVLLAVEDLWYVDGLSKKETVNTITFIFYTKTEPSP